MDSREQVVRLLESYHKRAKQIALLHYELKHAPGVSPEEVLGAMSFGHGDGAGHGKGPISNKTLYIALNYQEQAEKLNAEAKAEIVGRLVDLEQDRLAYYVSLLDKRQGSVIRQFYFEARSLEEIAGKINVALRTVYKIKSRAIDRLAEMYNICGDSPEKPKGQA